MPPDPSGPGDPSRPDPSLFTSDGWPVPGLTDRLIGAEATPAQRWSVAVASAVAGVALTVLAATVVPGFPAAPLIAAVVVSATFGGLRPGLLTALLCVAGTAFFVAEPRFSLRVGAPGDLTRLVLFAVVAVLVSAFSERLRTARQRAAALARQLAERNETLDQRNQQLAEQALELEMQTAELEASNQQLQEQQIELEATNEQLQQQGAELEVTMVQLREQQAALAGQRDALEAARDRLALATAASALGVYDWDLTTDVLTWDARTRAILGVPPGEPASLAAFYTRLHPDERTRVGALIDAACDPARARADDAGRPTGTFDTEYRIVGADGAARLVRSTGRVLFAPAERGDGADDAGGARAVTPGRALRFTGTLRDVTADRALEAEARESAARFRRLADTSAVGFLLGDPVGGLTYVNDAMLAMLGYARADVDPALGGTPLRWDQLTPAEDAARDADALRQLAAGGHAAPYEKHYRARDGRLVPILISPAVTSYDADGRVAEIAAVVVDMTREREARARTARLQAATAALSQAATPEAVALAATGAVVDALAAQGAVAASLAIREGDGLTLRLLSATAHPDGVREAWSTFPLAADVPLAIAARDGTVVEAAGDAALFPRWAHLRETLETLGARAFVAVPLHAGGTAGGSAGAPGAAGDRTPAVTPLGALALLFDRPAPLDADARALLDALGQLTAQALERSRLLDAEHAARAEAEAANRAKSEFLASMSHELRTPLNAIQGYVQLMEMGLHGPVTEAQREALGRVGRAQKHLLGLITDILNYAKLESGKIDYHVAAVRADVLVAEVLAMVEPQLATGGLTCTIEHRDGAADDGPAAPRDPPPDAPLEVWADRERLAQVLLNLLSNAVKFTPPGGRVTVELVTVAGSPECASIRVRDTGVGIPTDQLERVFEPFVQLHRRLPGATPVGADNPGGQHGTGLGLAISRDLARGMGGELTCESAPGAGATFTLALRRVVSATGEPVDRRGGGERRGEQARRSGDDRREGDEAAVR